MNLSPVIGRVKAPGQTAHEFTFIAPDPHQQLQTGEFITYEMVIEEETQTILSRITGRQALRLYPAAFAGKPELDPAEIAAMVGYQATDSALFEFTAAVVGYYHEPMAAFVNPRLLPPPGAPVYLADDELLGRVLNRQQPGEMGAAHIGSLLTRPAGRVPITLDVATLVNTHLTILASTGAGKSYLAGVLVEEMLRPHNRAAVLVIDPHGEYGTLAEMADHPVFRTADYRPKVQVLGKGSIKLRPASLTLTDLLYLLPTLSERMEFMLHKAYSDVRQQSKQRAGDAERWTRQELKAWLEELVTEKRNTEDGRTAAALLWRLRSVLDHSSLFDDAKQLPLASLCYPGQCTVLQLHDLPPKEQQLVVAALLRRLYFARKRTHDKEVTAGHELYLPYPVFILIEEAHVFAPAGGEGVVSNNTVAEVMSEGRKFGVSVGLISQRPGKLNSDALAMCNTHLLLRMVNPNDQMQVVKSVEAVGRELLAELPALSKGQAIVSGSAVNTPVICQVRSRFTTHSAENRNAPAEWLEFTKTQANLGQR